MPNTFDSQNINGICAVPIDYVFIVEKSTNLVPVSKKEYIFEGICARFGILNNNKRMYSKEDYLPHLEYLNDKIRRRRLVGELDHPPAFDISLRNISHIVEKLWYDENENAVKIRIRLLDTPHGRIARTLADAEIPFAISSRSAGQILEGHNVKLHHIFTFDLVAEPGFADAIMLPTLSESVQENYSMIFESFNGMRGDSVFNKLSDFEDHASYGENVRIYKINEDDQKLIERLCMEDMPQNKNTKQQMEDTLSRAEFSSYTEKLTQELAAIKQSQLNSMNQLIEKINEARGQMQQQIQLVQPFDGGQTQAGQLQVGQAQDGQQPVQKLQGQQQEQTTELPNITADDDNKTVIDKLVSYTDFLALQLQNVMNHTNYVTEMLNRSIAYSENMGAVLNKHVNHTNYMAKKLNEAINYMDLVGSRTNESINFSNYLSETLNDLANYSNLIGNRVNETINFSNYLSDVSNMQINHSNYLSNIVENSIASRPTAPSIENRNLESNVVSVSESAAATAADVKKIVSKINENSQDGVMTAKYPFLKLINEDARRDFYNLDMQTKQSVILALESSAYTNENDVLDIINAVITHKNIEVPNYIKYMPSKYKAVYESMSQPEKESIAKRAGSGIYRLNTPYQVKSFWDSQKLDMSITENIQTQNLAQTAQQINEGQSTEGLISIKRVADMQRGYTDDYVASIIKHANR